MWKAVSMFMVGALALTPRLIGVGDSFDGNWMTTLTCPAKGNTDGYTWKIPSAIAGNQFRAERGTAGEPGYLLLEGAIAADGNATLTASGVVASRQYARGVFAHKGEDYSYAVKAHFSGDKGTGTRDAGMGIVGRPCTFDFVRQADGGGPAGAS